MHIKCWSWTAAFIKQNQSNLNGYLNSGKLPWRYRQTPLSSELAD
jgi:hypothetical protein